MFNFFDEVKKTSRTAAGKIFEEYSVINISGKILYAEGVVSLLKLSKENVSFKTRSCAILVEGEDLVLDELSTNTIKIVGKIKKVEQIWNFWGKQDL